MYLISDMAKFTRVGWVIVQSFVNKISMNYVGVQLERGVMYFH